MTTVAMKAAPRPRATSRSLVLSMTILLETAADEDKSSDVIKTIMAVTASQRPTSDALRGKFNDLSPSHFVCGRYCFAVGRGKDFLDTNGFAGGFGNGAGDGADEGAAYLVDASHVLMVVEFSVG